MPKAWSAKDERQYEHVKDSELDKGRPTKRAKEIAARTVNKQRREEGRTPNKRTQGTGNPNRSLDSRTRDELYNRAKELDIPGRSRMSKAELLTAVRGGRSRAAVRSTPRARRRVADHDSEGGYSRAHYSRGEAMITMRQFLEANGLTGDTTPATDNPLDAPMPGVRHYRVHVRGRQGTFETYVSRPPAAPEPSVGDALAEAARRAVAVTAAPSTSHGDPVAAKRAEELERLRRFLGEARAHELVFEFGRREPREIETGDPVGNPARPEEMTNQEPDALRQAWDEAAVVKTPVVLSAIPPLTLAAGSVLFAKGHHRASAISLAAGVATAVAGARAYRWAVGRREAAQEDKQRRLADQHSAIQAGQ